MIARVLAVASAVVFGSLACNGRSAPSDTAPTDHEVVGTQRPAAPVDRPAGARIDAHSHLIGVGAWPVIEATLDAQNIDYIFNLSGGSPRRGMSDAMQLAQLSGGRIINFMTVDWRGFGEVAWGEVVAEELELAVTRYGFGGLKISKALGLFVRDADDSLVAVDDPRLFPLWERAGALGVPVFIHTGDPAAFWEPVSPENERYDELSVHPGWSFAGPQFPSRETLLAQRDNLLSLFPGTTFVGVHFANNPEDLDYVEQALSRYPNLYVDIGARVPEIGRHDPARVRSLFERFSDRILFATDIVLANDEQGIYVALGSSGAIPDTVEQIPTFYDRHYAWLETDATGMAHPTPIQGNWTVDGIGLGAAVLDAVYYENAHRLVVGPVLERAAGTRDE